MELKEFKIKVLPLRSKLLKYACRLAEHGEDAEDIVQEVLLKLWNRRLELEQYRSIEAFAMVLTRNACLDLWRRGRDYELVEHQSEACEQGTPDRLLEIKDEVELVHRIIDSLPPLQRSIMRMKDVEEYETEEIAQITGCSTEAVRGNLSRARKKVRTVYLQVVQEKKRRNSDETGRID